MSYTAPVKDMLFNLQHLADIDQIAQIPGFEDANLETAQAVLEECARFNQEVIAPLNWEGDKNPSAWKDGAVSTTPGFKEAYAQYRESGWQGLQHPTDFGGQGLPKSIGALCGEILNSANLSFALCPLLTDGAIEALLTAGSDELKATYLDKLISGEWSGTMNLTEPQAGSDLSMVRSRAEPQPDGTYKIFGTKIYITYGEHDMADNIVHLVLARVQGAPEGVKGISLFLVPLVKGYSTEMSIEVASLGVQVHGGMGFIEETGAAQHYRDAKILTIYEGTTAIQANDLVGRKTARDGGQSARAMADQIAVTEAQLRAHSDPSAQAFAKRLQAAREAFVEVVDFVAANTRANPNAAFAGSVPYLMLAGNLMAGWQMGRALLVALDPAQQAIDKPFMQAKAVTARFYADHILVKVPGLRDSIVQGADSVIDMALEAY